MLTDELISGFIDEIEVMSNVNVDDTTADPFII